MGWLNFFENLTFSQNLLLPLGWVWVIKWLQYGQSSTNGDLCGGHKAHIAIGLSKAPQLLI